MKKERHNQANIAARTDMVNALLRLLEQKAFSEISISELCHEAGLSRMTFYRNYESTENILSSHLEDILSEYEIEAKASKHAGTYYDCENLCHCFSFFSEHRQFLDGLFKCGMGHMFLDALKKYIMNTWNNDPYNLILIYTLQAFAGSLYNLYIYWSEHNYQESPEHLAFILNKIFGDNK